MANCLGLGCKLFVATLANTSVFLAKVACNTIVTRSQVIALKAITWLRVSYPGKGLGLVAGLGAGLGLRFKVRDRVSRISLFFPGLSCTQLMGMFLPCLRLYVGDMPSWRVYPYTKIPG